MKPILQRPATAQGLFVWVLHRFAEVFEEHAVVKGGIAAGNENALAVALVPGQRDLQEIKELLFLILQQLTRNGEAAGAGPATYLAQDLGAP